jgi:predicted dithiol-disulfide oxidoreductase (DUF899 family)
MSGTSTPPGPNAVAALGPWRTRAGTKVRWVSELPVRHWPVGASAEYLAAREKLLDAERALLEQVRTVGELRRSLPLSTVVGGYTFTEGPRDLSADEPVVSTTLADLVGQRSLVVYHLMFDDGWEQACASCSMWLDGLNGVAHHLAQVTDFVVIAKARLPKIRSWARRRDWIRLRLLSSHGTTFNVDFGAEDDKGGQWPMVSVFTRHDGAVWHSYTTAMIDNSTDLLTPVWHIEDLLPQGRGDWEPTNALGEA